MKYAYICSDANNFCEYWNETEHTVFFFIAKTIKDHSIDAHSALITAVNRAVKPI